MRLLIAAGGTGGHIYPALAVATSLRRRPGRPELAWVGGRRGLEDRLVPPAGIPLRRLLLRSLRTVQRDVHLVLDPIRLGALRARRRCGGWSAGGPRRSSRRAATSRSRCCSRPGCSGSRRCSGRATSSRAAASARRPGSPRRWRSRSRPTCRALPRRRGCFVTGHADPRRRRAIDRDGGARAARHRRRGAARRRLRRLAGRAAAQRRRRRARCRRSPSRRVVIHVAGAGRPRRGRGGPRARCRSRSATATGPAAFLGEELLDALAAADLIVGRAGSSTLAEAAGVRRADGRRARIPTPAPTSGPTPRSLADAGAGELIDDDGLRCGRAARARSTSSATPARTRRCARPLARMGRPGSADAVAELLLALAERRPLPDPAAVARIAAAPMAAQA